MPLTSDPQHLEILFYTQDRLKEEERNGQRRHLEPHQDLGLPRNQYKEFISLWIDYTIECRMGKRQPAELKIQPSPHKFPR